MGRHAGCAKVAGNAPGLVLLAVICCTGLAACVAAEPPTPQTGMTDMIFFISDQRIGAIRPDGSGECYPDFTLPEETHWRLGYVSPDGRWAEISNLPFYGVQSTEPLRKWRYDFVSKTLTEIPRILGEALPGGERFLQIENTGPGPGGVFTLFTTDRDGGSREDVFSGPGYAYGVSLRPAGRKVAYHITNTPGHPGYEIYAVDIQTKGRVLIASDDQYLHFAPVWSPDSQWLVYQRCAFHQDPGHERSDLCLSRADGTQHRALTTGQRHWFGANYGTPERQMGGSNMPVWAPGSKIACTLFLPDSQPPWPLVDGVRGYHPELAKGGTQVCLIDPATGETTPITHDDPPTWNFRLAYSPDGSRLAGVRADVGKMPALWVMDADGGNRRFLTRGRNGAGVDHIRWVRLAVPSL